MASELGAVVMKAGRIILFTISVFMVFGCAFNNPPPVDEGAVNYYSKEVETSTYVDPDDSILEPVEIRIYDEQGKLTAISKNIYSVVNAAELAALTDDYPIYKVSRTNVYEVSSEGKEEMAAYYLYTYYRDEYQYVDDDGVTQDAVDYVLLRGETRTPDDVLRLYYDVTYPWPDAANYDVYETIIDVRTSDSLVTARQESTYILHGDGVRRFITEKYYNLDSSDVLKLSKEFATWYDADPFDYLYDLYHSFRSDDTGAEEEFYYFTRYSRDGNGYIYEQADYDYDYAASAIPIAGDKSFTVPFVYDIEFAMIKDKATVLTTKYDSLGNIIRDERSLNGELNEYTTYAYNRASELTDELRYTKGGSLLRDRKTLRYTDEYREDEYFRIKETCVFKYYDYNLTNESQAESRSLNRPAGSFMGKTDEQIRENKYLKMNEHYRSN